MLDRLESLENRYNTLNRELMDPVVQGQNQLFQEKAKAASELEEVVRLFHEYKALLSHMKQAEELLGSEKDPELVAMASAEKDSLGARKTAIEAELQAALLPKDPNDLRNVFLEVRAGTGGEEAALFAGTLVKMYTRFAESRGWAVEAESISPSDTGGIKEAILLVKGRGAYRIFKHEAGVHRVQRVPATEASGRIHTSTATLIVMPELEEKESRIDDKDLKWEVFCSSGAGGQSVNTTYSAVRVTHLPTGVVVSMQDERKQLKNKEKALKVLAARVKQIEKERSEAELGAERKGQVKSGDRSEKIRTYNFPQSRVTDHRVGLSVYNLEAVLNGDLDAFVDKLLEEEQKAKLEALAPV
ncbi:MAG: peptide chain release factor 1 [candidate division FCPU426 bacterium]